MKLGSYIGLHAEKPDLSISDHEVDEVLLKKQKEHAFIYSIDHRPAASNDEVVIDFLATINEKPIPGGKANGYHLMLGSHRFIEGMEASLIGRHPGESYDVTLRFPTNYRTKELQDKEAVFHVTLQRIFQSEYQPLDDDFALDYSEYASLEDWKSAIREELEARRAESAMELLSRELLTQIIQTSQIPLDHDFVDEVAEQLYDDFLDELDMNNIPLPLYCKRNRITEEQILEDKKQEAIEMISAQYVLHGIAETEQLEADPDMIQETLASIAAEQDITPEELLDALEEEELDSILDEILMESTMQFIIQHAILD